MVEALIVVKDKRLLRIVLVVVLARIMAKENNLRRMTVLVEVLVYPNCRSFVPGNLEMVEEFAVSLRTDNSQ